MNETARMRAPSAFFVAYTIFAKDLRIELRTREIVATASIFAVVIGFLASLAFHVDEKNNASVAAGTLWISIFFASVLSFGRVWQRERDESALTGLLVAPIPRAAIFVGKAMATLCAIAIIEVPLLLLCLFLFEVHLDDWGSFLSLLGMGTAALSFVGTLFGVMTVRTSARDLILAIVLFPLLSPVLLCGVVATRRVFEQQPPEAYDGFVQLMGLSVLLSLTLGAGLFGLLIEE